MLREKKRILVRHPENPILTAEDFPYDICTVFNTGVVKQGPKKYTMVARVENTALERYLWVCDSEDGIHFKPRPKPVAVPDTDPLYMEYVDGGRQRSYFDPRVTPLEGKFYITHAAHMANGCQMGLFRTDGDFEKFEWMGLISLPDNRNATLFPEKIGGKYWRMDRPNVEGAQHIWTQQSPDLIHWGVPRVIVKMRDQVRWAQTKIGPGAVPIKTPEGWLCIIHGVRPQCTDLVYQLGVMLLDLENPNKVIGVAKRAILWPETQYELVGQTPAVVFTNAAILEDDGTVKIYYGGADTVGCLATARVEDLIHACKHE